MVDHCAGLTNAQAFIGIFVCECVFFVFCFVCVCVCVFSQIMRYENILYLVKLQSDWLANNKDVKK